MEWQEKQIVLRRLGYFNFEIEDEYDEFYSELDPPQQRRISKAMCEADEYGMPNFNWNRSYFKTNKITLYGKEPINCCAGKGTVSISSRNANTTPR